MTSSRILLAEIAIVVDKAQLQSADLIGWAAEKVASLRKSLRYFEHNGEVHV